jgi:hypothetical protein
MDAKLNFRTRLIITIFVYLMPYREHFASKFSKVLILYATRKDRNNLKWVKKNAGFDADCESVENVGKNVYIKKKVFFHHFNREEISIEFSFFI